MVENGSELWLGYAPLSAADIARSGAVLQRFRVFGDSPTAGLIRNELKTAYAGLVGDILPVDLPAGSERLLVGTPSSAPAIAALKWDDDLAGVGPEGFILRSVPIDQKRVTVIAANSDRGALYGTFDLLRRAQTGEPLDRMSVLSSPRTRYRLLNHWDNLDGTIERGYAGRSLWQWDQLPKTLSPRYTAYARANASIGINGAVLNNVNADPRLLTADYINKVCALADLWRPWGVQVYLSANFGAPVALKELPTADPLDPAVVAWWRNKADEIYRSIPDFGGFLVKANSEGQPGPQDYHRSHADGANLLADALAPHHGIVMWRAFVYDESVDADRAKRAYKEFKPLDGKFNPNVIVQVKNGPIDFQPREPFHPLFGAMPQTPLFAELQPTEEYLGQSKHLVFLGTMWEEFANSDTAANGPESLVGKVLDGSLQHQPLTGMAGVANTGDVPNWCGHPFSQANWYAFGRLAWDWTLPAEHMAEEWIRTTLTRDDTAVDTLVKLMLGSREAFVSYTMPLGLHHLIGGTHYAPMPWNDTAPRKDWTAVYYHRAAPDGIGFDRTTHGDAADTQYFPPVQNLFDSLDTCPEKLLLYFHRVPWNHRMRSGRTLWDELVAKYYSGHQTVVQMQATWASLAPNIAPATHRAVTDLLVIQEHDAATWRDACLTYFARFSGLPIHAPTTQTTQP